MKRIFVGLAGIATMLALAPSAGAATITVSTTADQNSDGAGTLCSVREAVAAALANADGASGCDDTVERVGAYGTGSTADEIVLTSASNHDLTEGQIQVGAGGPIVIRSNDPAVRRTITMSDDSGENRIFHLNNAVADLTLRTLRVTNADDVLTGTGGVIYAETNDSKLTVENSEVNAVKTGLNARNGGVIAINGAGSSLTIRDSVITGGEVSAFGGGVHSNGTPVTIERSKVHTNRSDASFDGQARGGGIFLDLNGNSTMTMTDSEVFNNDIVATTCPIAGPCSIEGGGIRTGLVPVTIKRSLISDNSVTSTSGNTYEYGGGIYSNATLGVSNTTFQDNVAGAPVGSFQGRGGAIVAYGTTTLTHDTFAGNEATALGDHLGQDLPGSTTYSGSVFIGGDDPCDFGSMSSGGYNAMSSADCNSTATDSVGGAPGVAGALADNGGTIVGGTGGAPIRTLAISNAGTAFNLVPVGAICTAAEGSDQRGASFTRPQLGACDAGAFEVQPAPVTTPPVAGPTGQRAAALKKCKKKKTKKKRKKCRKRALQLPV